MENTLHKYFNPLSLKLAYYRVLCWQNRLIKDKFGLRAIGHKLDQNLASISERIISGEYRPQRGFKYYEPKSSGTQRTKTLLFAEDAIVFQAIANLLAQQTYPNLTQYDDFVFGSVLSDEVIKGTKILEEENPDYFFFKFWKSLYGRFKESVIKSIVDEKAAYKFETDITGFFDSIPHYNLLLTLNTQFGVEEEILDLLSTCLNAWSGTKDSPTPGVGIPQGPAPSYFLANLLLHPLDKIAINDAYKYYRYMDDIHIYGYSEEELVEALVKIDQYLKGNGLSINSKKTRIEKIQNSIEDETVKELKKFVILGEEYNTTPKKSALPSENLLTKQLSQLADQTPGEQEKPNLDKITDPDEIKSFWRQELKDVEKGLPSLFSKTGKLALLNPEETEDLDFIKLSTKYGHALQALNESSPTTPNTSLLKYWLFAFKKYKWRANNFILTLQHYRQNKELKQELIDLYKHDLHYEFFRYHTIICLTYNFNFNDKELRDFFKLLKEEKSELVRYSIYCLLIKHSTNGQLHSSIRQFLSGESTAYLKLIVLDFWKSTGNRDKSMNELINSIGL